MAEVLAAAGYGKLEDATYEWGCQIGGLIYPHDNEPSARKDARFDGKYPRKLVRRAKPGIWEVVE